MKFKAIIFDLDGTLVDSLFDLGSSMNKVLLRHNYPIHAMDRYRHFVGNGMRKLVERALPNTFEHDIEFYLDELLTIYADNCLMKTQTYTGIEALLQQLKDASIQMAIITNKKHELTDKIIEDLLSDFTFEAVMGDLNDGKRKPDPYHTLAVMETMGVRPSEVLFVGDSNVDIETAQNAGVESCGVLWGFRTKTELIDAGATYVVEKPSEIFEIIH